MKKTLLFAFAAFVVVACTAQKESEKSVSKNGVDVSWYYHNERVHFTIVAPTKGWVTIGFNSSDRIEGAYLLMGNVENDRPNVVEHHTISPGNYQAISDLGAKEQVKDISGEQTSNRTTLKFSLPIASKSIYRKALSEGTELFLIMAYSREDDFKHHSMMRTSIQIKL